MTLHPGVPHLQYCYRFCAVNIDIGINFTQIPSREEKNDHALIIIYGELLSIFLTQILFFSRY